MGARARLSGEAEGVASLAFSPDGKAIVAGGTSGRARVWDTQTHKLVGTIGKGKNAAWSRDGKYIAAIKQDCGAGEPRHIANGRSFNEKSDGGGIGIIGFRRQPDRLPVSLAIGLTAMGEENIRFIFPQYL